MQAGWKNSLLCTQTESIDTLGDFSDWKNEVSIDILVILVLFSYW